MSGQTGLPLLTSLYRKINVFPLTCTDDRLPSPLTYTRWLDEIAGGWSTSLTYAAQTGTPFTVSPNVSTASGGGARISGARSIRGWRFARSEQPKPDLMPHTGQDQAELFQPVRIPKSAPGEMISDSTHPVGSVNPDGVPVEFQAPVTDRATAIALLGSPQNNIYGPG